MAGEIREGKGKMVYVDRNAPAKILQITQRRKLQRQRTCRISRKESRLLMKLKFLSTTYFVPSAANGKRYSVTRGTWGFCWDRTSFMRKLESNLGIDSIDNYFELLRQQSQRFHANKRQAV